MDKVVFIFLLCFYSARANIRINDLKVPQSIESGTVDDVILDCDFETDGEPGIEVKWFVNGLVEQIYQWIPETNKPGQAIGKYRDNIDTMYKITNEKNTMYRALHLVNLTPELSGNYSCKVSGDASEAVVTKSMIIYEPADSGLDLAIAEDDLTIFCTASGIYPEPEMKIYISNGNESEVFFEEIDEISELGEDGLYNVSSTLYFSLENLTNPFSYGCELEIPGTDYRLKEKRIHYLEESVDDIETQIEEDYFLNGTALSNSTDNSDGEMEETDLVTDFHVVECTECETQIEDDVEEESSVETMNSNDESGSVQHLSSLLSLFLSTLILNGVFML